MAVHCNCLPACLPARPPARLPALLQIINVDDNTVAFAQWGLGTMGPGEALEELPDTVVSKKSRRSVAGPPSAGKTPGMRRCWLLPLHFRCAVQAVLGAAYRCVCGFGCCCAALLTVGH